MFSLTLLPTGLGSCTGLVRDGFGWSSSGLGCGVLGCGELSISEVFACDYERMIMVQEVFRGEADSNEPSWMSDLSLPPRLPTVYSGSTVPTYLNRF